LQKQFHYNAEGAQQIEQQQIEDDKRYQANVAAAITAQFNAAKAAKEAREQAPYSDAGLGDSAVDASPIGKAAPPLDMQKWVGTRPDLDGKYAIISVWSPKSASCRKWIPALNNLHTNLIGKLEIVGVTSATEAEVSESDPKPDFACGLDPDSKFMNAAGITMLPCVLLVDPNRIVRYEGHPAALNAGVLQEVFTNTPAQ
jgi:cytochrome c biogenesis protein CcmG/thiol:disulfide interchange protein DsbE